MKGRIICLTFSSMIVLSLAACSKNEWTVIDGQAAGQGFLADDVQQMEEGDLPDAMDPVEDYGCESQNQRDE